MIVRKIVLFAMLMSVCFLMYAQGEGEKEQLRPVDFTLQFKNMHLWRGMEVSSGAVLATDIKIRDKKDIFNLGLWGGVSLDGDFKEFDYYASFHLNGFSLSVWDIYNFSPGATYNNKQQFNYSARETGHFVDVSLSYRLAGKFPLWMNWSTIVFGRDRDARNEKNRYSSFVALEYPVLRSKIVRLDAGVAGAFALDKGKDEQNRTVGDHFYGTTPGIVDMHLTASRTLTIFGYHLPVSATAMWNPQRNYANLQIAVNLF